MARRLAGHGTHVVVADLDDDAGRAVAHHVGGVYVRCDVRQLDDNLAAVEAAVDRYGALHLAFLNAGVTTGCTLGDDFDLESYRRAMAVNFDGVVFGVHAAIGADPGGGRRPHRRHRQPGRHRAGPLDPVYAANKHAVVGLIRSLGTPLFAEGIRVNAVCPAFADTTLVDEIRTMLDETGVRLLQVDDVVDACMRILESDEVGQCWFAQPGRPSQPFTFRNAPRPHALGLHPASFPCRPARRGYGNGTRPPSTEGAPMPQPAWSDKRERQYEHIKEGLQEHGRSEDQAEEIAARTVNKEPPVPVRRRHGAIRRSRTSPRAAGAGCARIEGRAAPHTTSCTTRPASATSPGRSTMTKAQLARACSGGSTAGPAAAYRADR